MTEAKAKAVTDLFGVQVSYAAGLLEVPERRDLAWVPAHLAAKLGVEPVVHLFSG